MKLRMGNLFCEWANKVFIGFLLTGVDSIKELGNIYNIYNIYSIWGECWKKGPNWFFFKKKVPK